MSRFDFDQLSKPMQRAVIDLVQNGPFIGNEAGWHGRYSHRRATVNAMAARGLCVHPSMADCVPTAKAQQAVREECDRTNAIIRRSEASR